MTDDDTFSPASVSVSVGQTVRWINSSQHSHTVTDDAKVASEAKDVSLPTGVKPFNSGKIPPGGTFEMKFPTPGTYKYVCEPHEDMDMKGQVVVRPAQ
jgi:plastocyanin